MDSMKRDPDGCGVVGLGFDGVLRNFDEERDVVDAVGLNPAQIKKYYEGLPMNTRFLTADGRNVPREKGFHPDKENVLRRPTEEERAESVARFEEYARNGLVCSNSKKSQQTEGNRSRNIQS